jgi:transcriptional regulator of acetoin/glycerol metabolism
MKKDMNDLKKLVHDILQNEAPTDIRTAEKAQLIRNLYSTEAGSYVPEQPVAPRVNISPVVHEHILDTEEFVEESLSLEDKEVEMIRKALEKHKGKRKYAAKELGISERTLYRKIKEHNIE